MNDDDYERAWNEPETKAWARRVIDDLVPKIGGSVLVTSLVPRGEYAEGDVKFWVETGASIMMDKPIVLVALTGTEIPPKLELVADEIVYVDDVGTEDAADAVAAAMERVIREEGLLDDDAH